MYILSRSVAFIFICHAVYQRATIQFPGDENRAAVHFAQRRQRWCRIVTFWTQLTPVDTVERLSR